jgi:tetratricopeptide (TPR) repeat protein
MPAQSDWHWTQVFGHFHGEATVVHHPDWETAWRGVDAALKAQLPVVQLAALDAHYTALAERAPGTILYHGSGWGALEMARRQHLGEAALPVACAFPDDSLTDMQQQWLTLLTHGQFPAPAPDTVPGEWMVQPAWHHLLLELPTSAHTWYSLLHLGVMHMEAGDNAAASAAWQASITLQPTPWAWRNLAIIALRASDTTAALTCYQQAWQLHPPVLEIAQEYIELLCRTEQFAHALTIYDTLSRAFQDNDRLLIMRCRIALELGDYATVERLVHHEYAVVREGESELTDLWFRMWYQRTSPDAPLNDAEKAAVRQQYPPPTHIDFRMIVN